MRPHVVKLYKESQLIGRLVLVPCFFIVTMALLFGCGKKADPVPLRYSLPTAVSDLRLERKEKGIGLTWSSTISEGRFKILRSEQLPEEACVDCPKIFSVISDLANEDSRLVREPSDERYSWIDVTATAEKIYSYQIVVCNTMGFCSEPSNIVDAPSENW